MEPQLMQTWVVSLLKKIKRLCSCYFCPLIPCLLCQFRDGYPDVDCFASSHCSASHLQRFASRNGVFYPWGTEGARNSGRNEQTSFKTQVNWTLWSHIWWGELCKGLEFDLRVFEILTLIYLWRVEYSLSFFNVALKIDT